MTSLDQIVDLHGVEQFEGPAGQFELPCEVEDHTELVLQGQDINVRLLTCWCRLESTQIYMQLRNFLTISYGFYN